MIENAKPLEEPSHNHKSDSSSTRLLQELFGLLSHRPTFDQSTFTQAAASAVGSGIGGASRSIDSLHKTIAEKAEDTGAKLLNGAQKTSENPVSSQLLDVAERAGRGASRAYWSDYMKKALMPKEYSRRSLDESGALDIPPLHYSGFKDRIK